MGSIAARRFTDRVIAQKLDVGVPQVCRWVARYANLGPKGWRKMSLASGGRIK